MSKKYMFFVDCVSYGHVFFIEKNTKNVFGFGSNENSQLGIASPNVFNALPIPIKKSIRKISTGFSHTIMLSNSGQVYSMGINGSGECCTGTFKKIVDSPWHIKDFSKNSQIVLNIETGEKHSIFILRDGIYGCGQNNAGVLGNGTTKDQCTAVKMKDINMRQLKDVKCGGFCTLILYQNGNVYYYGDLSNISYHKKQKGVSMLKRLLTFPKDTKVLKLFPGRRNFFFLTTTFYNNQKKIYALGHVYANVMTLQYRKATNIPSPIDYLNKYVNSIIDIKIGYGHTLILLQNGQVIGFGNQDYLGNAVTNKMQFLTVPKAIQIEVGESSTYIFDINKKLWVSGYGGQGRLGTGNSESVTSKFIEAKIDVSSIEMCENFVEKAIKEMRFKLFKNLHYDVIVQCC